MYYITANEKRQNIIFHAFEYRKHAAAKPPKVHNSPVFRKYIYLFLRKEDLYMKAENI